MSIEWLLFAPALLLLLFPGDRLMSPRVELFSFDRGTNRSAVINRGRWMYVRWVEPLRSFGGAYALKLSLPLATDLWHYVSVEAYALFIGILLVGLIAQLPTHREEGALLAPVGYMVGLLFALLPWPMAAVGIVSGVTGLFAFRQLHGFFGFTGAVIGLVGLLFRHSPMWLIPAVGLLFVPVFAGLLTGRTLEMPLPADTKPS